MTDATDGTNADEQAVESPSRPSLAATPTVLTMVEAASQEVLDATPRERVGADADERYFSPLVEMSVEEIHRSASAVWYGPPEDALAIKWLRDCSLPEMAWRLKVLPLEYDLDHAYAKEEVRSQDTVQDIIALVYTHAVEALLQDEAEALARDRTGIRVIDEDGDGADPGVE